jgi:hypothetical protein
MAISTTVKRRQKDPGKREKADEQPTASSYLQWSAMREKSDKNRRQAIKMMEGLRKNDEQQREQRLKKMDDLINLLEGYLSQLCNTVSAGAEREELNTADQKITTEKTPNVAAKIRLTDGLIDNNTTPTLVAFPPGEQIQQLLTKHDSKESNVQRQNSDGHSPTPKMPTTDPRLFNSLIVCRRQFPDPKYCKCIQLSGEIIVQPTSLTAKRTAATASTAIPSSTTCMAMATIISAKQENSRDVDSEFIFRAKTNFTTAPTNQQDSTAALPPEQYWKRYWKFRTLMLGATTRKEHYHAFRRPPPTRDKTPSTIKISYNSL